MWDFCAWIGVIVLVVLSLKVVYFVVESIAVARVGWPRWYRFKREVWACTTFSTLPEDPDF